MGTLLLGLYLGAKYTERLKYEERRNLEYALQHQYDRLKAGVDADDRGQPYTSTNVIDGEFMDAVRKNGRATTWLRKERAQ